jgi:hypothetical protein
LPAIQPVLDALATAEGIEPVTTRPSGRPATPSARWQKTSYGIDSATESRRVERILTE